MRNGREPAAGGEELLHETPLIRITRRLLPDGRRMIVKEMRGASALSRVRHERRILERLREVPGVPRLAEGSFPATVIALVDPCARPVLAGGGLEGSGLVALAERVARVLASVHGRGIAHRNINPENLLVSAELAPTLIGFGLATTLAEERPVFVQHREIAGHLGYLAPEQTGRTGHGVDQRADLYSFGATLYRLASGVAPFGERDQLQLIHDVLAAVPPPLSAQNPSLPPALSDIVMRLLEKEPERRYQSAEGVAHDLARLSERLAAGVDAPFPLGERDFPLRVSPPCRLVGREGEARALREALQRAVEGRGSCLLVCGAPGVGKSTLINELRPLAADRGGFFVSGKFDQYRRDLSSDAIYQAMRAAGRLLLAEPEEELVRFTGRLRQSLGPNAALVASFLPEFALLTGSAPDTAAIDPLHCKERLIQATLDNLRAISSPERPLVMVLDDLQWGASTPLGLVEAVMNGEPIAGLLVVGSFRDRVEPGQPLSLLLSRREELREPTPLLRLGNLSGEEFASFLQEMLHLRAGEGARLAAAVARRTGGNPYHTIEFVNSLRLEGALSMGENGWQWDEEAIRRHLDEGDLADLLESRLDRLPPPSQRLMEVMACLGGELDAHLVALAAGLSCEGLEEAAAPCLEEGLLVAREGGSELRFRHDRVQQAAYRRLQPEGRQLLHLALARRLAAHGELEPLAAEQYLPALAALHDPAEKLRAVSLFRSAAARQRGVNYQEADRFLGAAIALLAETASPEGELLPGLEMERHAALYAMGRLEEADQLYRSLQDSSRSPLQRADAVCLQVCSLTNRARPREAVALGLAFLEELGFAVPREEEVEAAARGALERFRLWMASGAPAGDRLSPELTEGGALAAAKLINKIIPPAFFSGQPMVSWWLVLESWRLWTEEGPCAALVGPLGHLSFASIWLAGDYRTGHAALRHLLSVSAQRGWEPETSQARFLYAMTVGPWFDPLRQNVALSLRAEEGLVKGGDLQNACFTYYATISQLLDCAPTLDHFQAELDRTLAIAARAGNAHMQASLLPYRKLVRELRGESAEGEEPAGGNPTSAGIDHSIRALSALLRGDLQELAAQVATTRELVSYMMATHLMARVTLLHALALAQQAKLAGAKEREELLGRLDRELRFLAERAADAPGNFAHQVAWLTAERAWGARDLKGAMRGFNAALEAVKRVDFPWQRALLTERAALFHQECGLAHLAGVLMSEAVELYREWGAPGKVGQLEESYPFLRHARRRQDPGAIALSADAIDMLAILQASRALSSETSLERLTAVVVEVLEKMTGATAVSLLVREEQNGEWQLLAAGGEAGGRLAVEEAATLGLIPLSLFRYLERTREPLSLEDATRDDRFRHDPYLAGYRCCSMLALPILNHGAPSALLLLENSLSRGAFTPERLDGLIAGQLAVSLENALLYQSLEEAVRRRTAELARANEALQADIVERKRAEQRTRDAYRRISDILEFLPDATFVVDAEGRIIAWNRAMELLTGVPKEEMLGRGEYAYAVPFYGEARKVLIDMLDEEPAVRERQYPGVKSDGKTLTAEARVMLGDRVYWMWSAATPLYNLQGEKAGGIQSLRDVTELRKSEQERSRLEAQLHHASMMEALMGQLGHDLKTPLTPLCALLPMIGRKCQDKAALHMLDICQQSVQQIQALSSKAQELVRLSCQQSPLHRTPLSLREAVEGCLTGCASLFLQRRIDCRNAVAPDLAVLAATDQLNLLLDNLLSNAARFASEGGSVLVSAAVEGESAVVSVIDDGIGLKPGETDRIFEEFFKADAARHDLNTQGLGLAICKRIVLNHKGRIWAESAGIGLGTTVSFTLDVARVNAPG